ncbi:Aminomethyltransferase, mitochondrial [Tilletia horrida]|nr:Aminomethyltransferase, mitochondrial [Tilletia horrida]
MFSVNASLRTTARRSAGRGLSCTTSSNLTAPAAAPAPAPTARSCSRSLNFSSSAPASSELARTGLYELHKKLGGKLVGFGGYEMPLSYSGQGQVASHHHVRNECGLFDVGHMVQHFFTGPGALAFLQKLTPSSLSSLAPFTSTLSVLLNKEGGILDDTVITKHADDRFYVVTNAGRRTEDLAWFESQLAEWNNGEEGSSKGQVKHEILDGWGLVALQGPKAAEVLAQLVDGLELASLTFGKSAYAKVKGVECHIARGGYTGEDGFEISIPPADTVAVTEALLAISPTQPAGLAARDSLRLEAGMCLYGHDLDESVSPVEGALAWVVGKDRRATADFLGAQRVLKELKEGPPRRRVGLLIESGPAAREGSVVLSEDGQTPIGVVTSGIPSPTLGQNIAMALVANGSHKAGTKLKVSVRNKIREAQVAKLPFVPSKFYRG